MDKCISLERLIKHENMYLILPKRTNEWNEWYDRSNDVVWFGQLKWTFTIELNQAHT